MNRLFHQVLLVVLSVTFCLPVGALDNAQTAGSPASGLPAASPPSDSPAPSTATVSKPVSTNPWGSPISVTTTNAAPAAGEAPNALTGTPPSSDGKPATAAPTAKAGALLPSEAAPGPCLQDRKNVRNWLIAASKRGVGINSYVKVWDEMEAAVKAGAPEAEIKAKVQSMCSSIADQVKASVKVNRPHYVEKKVYTKAELDMMRASAPPQVKWVGPEITEDKIRKIGDKWEYDELQLLKENRKHFGTDQDEIYDKDCKWKVYQQKKSIVNEMTERWRNGERSIGARKFKNMHQELYRLRRDGDMDYTHQHGTVNIVKSQTGTLNRNEVADAQRKVQNQADIIRRQQGGHTDIFTSNTDR